mmetsp:Transcript_82833/g.234699  ORF Transcript_82833/g.234699 Transcript_82833/m.234699 type:complete len:142 (-) Transcript_82833:315-740(-)
MVRQDSDIVPTLSAVWPLLLKNFDDDAASMQRRLDELQLCITGLVELNHEDHSRTSRKVAEARGSFRAKAAATMREAESTALRLQRFRADLIPVRKQLAATRVQKQLFTELYQFLADGDEENTRLITTRLHGMRSHFGRAS